MGTLIDRKTGTTTYIEDDAMPAALSSVATSHRMRSLSIAQGWKATQRRMRATRSRRSIR
jgi:hypothetical protein